LVETGCFHYFHMTKIFRGLVVNRNWGRACDGCRLRSFFQVFVGVWVRRYLREMLSITLFWKWGQRARSRTCSWAGVQLWGDISRLSRRQSGYSPRWYDWSLRRLRSMLRRRSGLVLGHRFKILGRETNEAQHGFTKVSVSGAGVRVPFHGSGGRAGWWRQWYSGGVSTTERRRRVSTGLTCCGARRLFGSSDVGRCNTVRRDS